MTILITGSAGFIASNLVLRLLVSKEPLKIIGFDNLNDYSDPSLKDYRLKQIEAKDATVLGARLHLHKRRPFRQGLHRPDLRRVQYASYYMK